MSDAKHTPGPWAVSTQGVGFEVDSADGWQVAQAQQRHEDGRGKEATMRLANARLIAAAPELLEALIEASEWVSEYVSQMRAYTISDEAAKSLRRIRAAIAKATGEQA